MEGRLEELLKHPRVFKGLLDSYKKKKNYEPYQQARMF